MKNLQLSKVFWGIFDQLSHINIDSYWFYKQEAKLITLDHKVNFPQRTSISLQETRTLGLMLISVFINTNSLLSLFSGVINLHFLRRSNLFQKRLWARKANISSPRSFSSYLSMRTNPKGVTLEAWTLATRLTKEGTFAETFGCIEALLLTSSLRLCRISREEIQEASV